MHPQYPYSYGNYSNHNNYNNYNYNYNNYPGYQQHQPYQPQFEFVPETSKFLNYKTNKIAIKDEDLREAKNMFEFYDRDKSGDLNRAELFHFLNQFFYRFGYGRMKREDLDFMFVKFDVNKNGRFSWDEVEKMLYELSGRKVYSFDLLKAGKLISSPVKTLKKFFNVPEVNVKF